MRGLAQLQRAVEQPFRLTALQMWCHKVMREGITPARPYSPLSHYFSVAIVVRERSFKFSRSSRKGNTFKFYIFSRIIVRSSQNPLLCEQGNKLGLVASVSTSTINLLRDTS
ncbi:hypothetical protein SCLCIDRAFT_466990 [Scleroderma citrinum Foug A]|uniref:Uncharacterized protein n=1 Tax=Scleroderma citrinum Foug A TaxID=1036808 RepID=A0A0C2ZV85_9AGAM|nr:hypothetical protein SCLCIDRAFT_466990 [Scleroderma citrinum Foug A]